MNECMPEQPEDRTLGHVLPNILSNLVFMLANFITGLLLVPYYIDVLGVSAYAIIPVATSVTGYITLISDALSSTVSRYLTIDLRTDMVSAKRTFNAAVVGFTWIVLAATPLVLIISVVAPMVFDISTNTVESVRMLFTFVIAAVLISVWSNNFVTVMYAKNGSPLMQEDSIDTLISTVIPLAAVLTPNIPEAEKISGIEIHDLDGMKRSAEIISRMGAKAVLVKGGHRVGNADDLLFDGRGFTVFPGHRIDTKNTHGTGCTLSSAIASYLALGEDLAAAVEKAKEYVTGAIEHALDLGKGNGPTDHFFMHREV